MNPFTHLNRTLLILAILLLAGCGIDRGGITETVDPAPTTPGFNEPGSATIGKIVSVTGSQIILNDISMDLDSTSIVLNGEPANRSALLPGMIAIATSQTQVSRSTPAKLEVNFNLAGESVLVDPAFDTFVILGQTVSINRLDLSSPAGMQLPTTTPDTIAVSGHFNSAGVLVATAVTSYPDTLPAIVTGNAQQIDPVNGLFNIGPQSYDFSQVVSLTTPTGSFTELERIRLQIEAENSDGRFPVVTAMSVPLIDPTLTSGALISLEGFVTEITDATTLQVSFETIVTNDATLFLGLPTSLLALDQLVLVSGTLQADGSVLARSIQLLD